MNLFEVVVLKARPVRRAVGVGLDRVWWAVETGRTCLYNLNDAVEVIWHDDNSSNAVLGYWLVAPYH